MVDRTRELERALGSNEKFVAENEADTVVVQRRCLRAARDLAAGQTLGREDIEVLRPSPREAIQPHELERAIGRVLKGLVREGDPLTWDKL
jgi:N-acetylneuraminate synthase